MWWTRQQTTDEHVLGSSSGNRSKALCDEVLNAISVPGCSHKVPQDSLPIPAYDTAGCQNFNVTDIWRPGIRGMSIGNPELGACLVMVLTLEADIVEVATNGVS
ncbi:hypothetical protein FQN55_002717 [Onygenales sp. PD_40]|nr:hypothetical protein FQN55_002717 [Onygenales sp. PD_40]